VVSEAAPVPAAAIVNLGCKVNQSEMEAAARLLRSSGARLVGDGQPADLVLVNTCTVTAEADRKSRHAVTRARRTSPDARIVVTGCSVQVDPEAFAAADPSARLIDNRAKDSLLTELEAELAALAAIPPGGDGDGGGGERLTAALPTLSGVSIAGVADDRSRVERTRAFVKVQDGCSFFCTYCIIPTARGPERSLAPELVIADIRRAVAAGHREIVLTGINIGTYDGGWSERGPRGSHVRARLTLAGLIRRILSETDVERLRLSSIEPQHVDTELLEAWVVGAPRTMPHLHLPLQSGDDGVLRRMGRRYLSADYLGIAERARAAIAGLAIHADVIVGFPTEDDTAFERSVAFVRSLELSGLHVFRYSSRPGTPAVRMAGHVDDRTRKRRATEMLEVATEARARGARRTVGFERSVLFERQLADGRWVGHTEDDVVCAVGVDHGRPVENAIGRVRVTAVDPPPPDRVLGRLIELNPPRRVPLAILGGHDAA
jgi:threonylcarbamoyladenosine tRNA methylthiotransferase MtaB